MTRTKKVLIGVASAILLLVVALVIAVALFNWNALRPTINEKVSEAIGRPFAINGDLTVQWRRPTDSPGWQGWVPWPYVTANAMMIGNPAWAKAPEMATLKRAEFTLAPLPLLTQRVVIRQIQLTGANVHLERLKDERANWEFTLPDSDGEPSKWVMDIDEIGFDQGEITYRDEILEADIRAKVDPLGKPIPYEAIVGTHKAGADTDQSASAARANKEHAKGEPAEAKADEKERASAPRAEGSAEQKADTPAREGAAVTVPAAERAASEEEASQPAASNDKDPDATTAQDKPAAVPEDYAFGWTAEGTYQRMPVKGEGKIGGMLALRDTESPFPVQADVRIGRTHIVVAGTLTDPADLGALDLRLALSGASMSDLYPLTGVTLPDTPPYSTDGHLVARLHEPSGPVYHYRGFNGKVGNSDLHGDLTYTDGEPRPKLQGELNSRLLRMVDLGPLIGVEPEPKRKAEDKESEAKDKVLPTQQFRTERWRDMDADVRLTADRIIYDEKLPITKLNVHLVMDNGILRLRPLRFSFAGGTIDSNIRLDGSKRTMSGEARIAVRGLRLRRLFPDVEAMQRALGQLNGDIALTGTGNSVAALLGTSNGDAQILINDGVISRGLMEIAGLNVGNYVVSKLFGDEEVKINCGVADMNMKNGVMTPRIFIFDTENAVVQISGDVNFKDETLDLDIAPESKGIRLFSLRSPLYVRGTFAHPDAGVHVLPLAARGVGAVALGVLLTPVASLLALVAPSSGESDEQCGAMMRQLQEPRKGGERGAAK